MTLNWKVSVPVPVPTPVSFPDPDNTKHSFSTTKKLVPNLAFSMSEEALFPRKLASQF